MNRGMKRSDLAGKSKAQLRNMAAEIARLDQEWGRGRSAWTKDELVARISGWSGSGSSPKLHTPILKTVSPKRIKAMSKRKDQGKTTEVDQQTIARMKARLAKDKEFVTNFNSDQAETSDRTKAEQILLNSWCRCVQSQPIGICSSSVYSRRGKKAPATRGKRKSWCDDDLAAAEVNLLKSGKKSVKGKRSSPKRSPRKVKKCTTPTFSKNDQTSSWS